MFLDLCGHPSQPSPEWLLLCTLVYGKHQHPDTDRLREALGQAAHLPASPEPSTAIPAFRTPRDHQTQVEMSPGSKLPEVS